MAKYILSGGSGVLLSNVLFFEFPRFDFLQFQHDIHSFSYQKGLLLGRQNPSFEVEHGGALVSPVYRLKKALTACFRLTNICREDIKQLLKEVV